MHRLTLAILAFPLVEPLNAQTSIPEPPVIFYGQVTAASPAPDLSTVTFTLAGNAETLTTAAPARIVSIEGMSWFIVSIPFETRTVQGGPALAASPGTLALTAADTTYTVTAKVGAASATLTTGKTTLIYGAPTQGLIDRIDLTLGGETYAQWSQRIFGSLISQTDDADGDGRSNYDEYLAGTDPQNSASHLSVTSFAPTPTGGFTLTWDTVSGKTYRVERSTTLSTGPWDLVQDNIPGDGQPKSVTDTTTAPRLFYRVAVIAPTAP